MEIMLAVVVPVMPLERTRVRVGRLGQVRFAILAVGLGEVVSSFT